MRRENTTSEEWTYPGVADSKLIFFGECFSMATQRNEDSSVGLVPRKLSLAIGQGMDEESHANCCCSSNMFQFAYSRALEHFNTSKSST